MPDIHEKIRSLLMERHADAIVAEDEFRGDRSFVVKADQLLSVMETLQSAAEIDVKLLSDITCVDWLNHDQPHDGRFEVVYNLYSLSHQYRFFVKVWLGDEDPTLPSLTEMWPGANWMEREVWDLFGITFEGHPQLEKILTPDELEGHPLRQDYPLTWEQPRFSWNRDDPPEVIR